MAGMKALKGYFVDVDIEGCKCIMQNVTESINKVNSLIQCSVVSIVSLID